MGDQMDALRVVEPADGDPEGTRFGFESRVEGKLVEAIPSLVHQPRGLRSAALRAGIKYADVLDFMAVVLPRRGPAAGVFTRNRCASPAVVVDREHLADGHAQALVVVSKNANVFTPTADADTRALTARVAERLGIAPTDVLVSCTGVIGVALPMPKIEAAADGLPAALVDGLSDDAARAILTTDRGMKVASIRFGEVVLAGMAKGAGMIEPNMATMLVYFFTNLAIDPEELRRILRRAADRSFNSISVDTDTSTSDTVIVLSTGEVAATPAHVADFELALTALSLKLARDICYQAEGATKLVEVTVAGLDTDADAKVLAKQVVNSPLMKTAIFGADPNWGRVVMAIGKPPGIAASGPIDPRDVRIAINGVVLFDRGSAVPLDLQGVSQSIRDRKKVAIDVSLGAGPGRATVWGCDLSYDYVRENAEYTT